MALVGGVGWWTWGPLIQVFRILIPKSFLFLNNQHPHRSHIKLPKTNLLPKLGPVESSHVSFDHRISSSLLVVLDSIDQSHLCNPTPARWKSRISPTNDARNGFGVLFLQHPHINPGTRIWSGQKKMSGWKPTTSLGEAFKKSEYHETLFFLEDTSPISLLFHSRSQRLSTKGCQKQKALPKKMPKRSVSTGCVVNVPFCWQLNQAWTIDVSDAFGFQDRISVPKFRKVCGSTLSNRTKTANNNRWVTFGESFASPVRNSSCPQLGGTFQLSYHWNYQGLFESRFSRCFQARVSGVRTSST